MKNKGEKTNAMRLLAQEKIPFLSHDYKGSGAISGMDVVAALRQDPAKVFKTLVTAGKSGEHYVFVIPVDRELDLKKAANAVGEKNISMVKSKDLLSLTGYVHGGCSPIGMKKQFVTVFDWSGDNQPAIIFSGGKIGLQIEVSLKEIKKIMDYQLADVVK